MSKEPTFETFHPLPLNPIDIEDRRKRLQANSESEPSSQATLDTLPQEDQALLEQTDGVVQWFIINLDKPEQEQAIFENGTKLIRNQQELLLRTIAD